MIKTHAGIDVGNHRAGATRGNGPSMHRVGRRLVLSRDAIHHNRGVGGLHKPLTAAGTAGRRIEQRIVRGDRMRITPVIHRSELHRGISPQGFERLVHVGTVQSFLQEQHVHARRHLPRAQHRQMGALRQAGDVRLGSIGLNEIDALRAGAELHGLGHRVAGGCAKAHHQPTGLRTDLDGMGSHRIGFRNCGARGQACQAGGTP